MPTDFPVRCIRGLRYSHDVENDGTINGTAFMPNMNTAADRTDGGVETSINWEDDDQAIQFSLDDTVQSKHGLALLPRARIDYEIERVQGKPAAGLSYERKELQGNRYHGNIVFAKDTRKRLLALLADALGFSATHHRRPDA